MGYKDAELALKAAIDLEGIQTSDRLVWLALAFHRNGKTGMCFPAIETLMAETGLSRQGVKNCVHHLEKLGVLQIIPGGGRKSNRYNLLIHHVDADDVQLFPVEKLDSAETPTRLVSSPQQASELPSAVNSVASCRLLSSPESGFLTHEVGAGKTKLPVNSSAGNGQLVSGGSKETDKTYTGETPVPPTNNDNGQILGRQSPDPSVTEEVPFTQEAYYLDATWKEHTSKRSSEEDFRWLLEHSGDDYIQIEETMSWMFNISDFWVKTSPAWETGPKEFDLINSRAFRTNYNKIRDSFQSWQAEVASTVARRKQKQVDDSGMTETINALRDDEVERKKSRINNELEEETFDDDDSPVASEHHSSTDADHADDEQAGPAESASELDDEDFPVSYHPDVQYLAGRWKDWFHSNIELSCVAKWLRTWSSDDLLRSFRFVAMDPAWKNAIPDADKFDQYIDKIMDASDYDAPKCAPSPAVEKLLYDCSTNETETENDSGSGMAGSFEDLQKQQTHESVFVPSIEEDPEPRVPIALLPVWKEVTEKHGSEVDFNHILRDHKSSLPECDPEQYVANVIRWAFRISNHWPDQMRTSGGFSKAFKAIREQYDTHMGKLRAEENIDDATPSHDYDRAPAKEEKHSTLIPDERNSRPRKVQLPHLLMSMPKP